VTVVTIAVIVAVVVGLASLQPKSKPTSVNKRPVADFDWTPSNLTVVFDASASNDPDGNISTYYWTFGDEDANGTGNVTTYTYPANGTYRVVLTVTDNGGEKNSTSKNLTVTQTVNPPPIVKKYPVALIELENKTNLTVVISGFGSYAKDAKTIVNYTWDFGDGTNASGANVTHTYAANGTYTITLTVTDSEGLTNSTTQDVTVTKQVTPPPPTPEKLGPPGLLHAIEIHEEKADRNSGLKNSLDHLEDNLDRWLDKHLPPEVM